MNIKASFGFNKLWKIEAYNKFHKRKDVFSSKILKNVNEFWIQNLLWLGQMRMFFMFFIFTALLFIQMNHLLKSIIDNYVRVQVCVHFKMVFRYVLLFIPKFWLTASLPTGNILRFVRCLHKFASTLSIHEMLSGYAFWFIHHQHLDSADLYLHIFRLMFISKRLSNCLTGKKCHKTFCCIRCKNWKMYSSIKVNTYIFAMP